MQVNKKDSFKQYILLENRNSKEKIIEILTAVDS